MSAQGCSPVAVPGIFLADGAASSSADRCHSLRSRDSATGGAPIAPHRRPGHCIRRSRIGSLRLDLLDYNFILTEKARRLASLQTVHSRKYVIAPTCGSTLVLPNCLGVFIGDSACPFIGFGEILLQAHLGVNVIFVAAGFGIYTQFKIQNIQRLGFG